MLLCWPLCCCFFCYSHEYAFCLSSSGKTLGGGENLSRDVSTQLSRYDVFVVSVYAIFVSKWTQTIQNLEHILKFPLYSNPSNPLCPEKLYRIFRIWYSSPPLPSLITCTPTCFHLVSKLHTNFLRENLTSVVINNNISRTIV